jgi:phosphatidylethanolamine-binding protein (PEBP) family uncharacterized protein
MPLLLAALLLAACGGDDADDVVIDDFADTIPLPGDSTTTTATAMTVTTTAFEDGGPIPVEHSCDGGNALPELVWSGEPAETEVIAITVVDSNNDIEHWIRIGDKDISPWFGPCPPPGDGPHSYVFTVHALDTVDVELTRASIIEHTIASATITGTYERAET